MITHKMVTVACVHALLWVSGPFMRYHTSVVAEGGAPRGIGIDSVTTAQARDLGPSSSPRPVNLLESG